MIAQGGPAAIAISRARYEAFAAARNEVRLLGTRHNVLLQWPREQWPRLLLPALFSEIFDIPKFEEDDNPASAAAAAAAASAAAAAVAATAATAAATVAAAGTAADAGEPVASSSQSPESSTQLPRLG